MTDRFRAILFDFDGTLVDSMALHYEAYRTTFAEMGLELAPAAFYGNIGGVARDAIPKFLDGRSAPWSLEQIHRRKKQRFAELLETADVPTLPAAHLLQAFAGHCALALCTAGSREGILLMLARLGWSSLFDVVLTAEDVARGKPAPDVYLKAAERLNVPPRQCLVLEDTDDGVQAGRAAGMVVIDVRSMTPHRPANLVQ